MQSRNEIRHHIIAVEQTRKITNAMYLISSARLKKAMQHIDYNDIYLTRVRTAMKDILLSPYQVSHPYLTTGLEGRRAYIVMAGDKGMVGSYNSQILDFAYTHISQCPDAMLVTIGVVASEYFRKKGIVPDQEIAGLSQDPSLYNARHLANDLIFQYDSSEVRSVYLIYTAFVRGVVSAPSIKRILPIRIHDYEDITETAPAHEIQYVPSADEVFGELVPQYLTGLLFGSLVQAYASEQSARMNSMQSATDNADELLKKLKQQYNIARQTAITQEIAEISSASMSLLTDDGACD